MSKELNHNPFQSPASDISPDATSPDGPRFVFPGYGRRMLAQLIDGIFCYIMLCLVGVVVKGVYSVQGQVQYRIPFYVAFAIFSVFPWLYYALQESSSEAATVAKRLMGIKVVDLRGQRLSFWRSSIRSLGKVLPLVLIMLLPRLIFSLPHPERFVMLMSIPGFLILIDYLLPLVNSRRQTLHDMTAGTISIINTPPETSAEPN